MAIPPNSKYFTSTNQTLTLDSNDFNAYTSVYVIKDVGVGNVFLNLTNNLNVTPSYQIIIQCSNIIINGQGNTFNFSNVLNYGGLNVIIPNLSSIIIQNIIIQNITIQVNQYSRLSLPYGGWICQGGSSGINSVEINNCHVISFDDITLDISNNNVFPTGYCGIICGGGNGIGDNGNKKNINGSDGNGGNYSFINCSVTAANNINFTAYQEISSVGGICGGGNGGGGLGITSTIINTDGGNGGKGNGGTYSFNECAINGTINITGILLFNGIICGGFNGLGGDSRGNANGIGSGGNGGDASGGIYTFTDCSVNGNIQVIGVFSEQSFTFIDVGGVCGGGNGRSGAAGNADISGNGGNGGTSDGGTYTFQNCNILSPIFDMSGLGQNMVGGICGGLNGFSGPGGTGGSITGNGGNSGNTNGGNYNYTSCNVTASTGITITGQNIISGGICGGENGQSATGGYAIGSGNGGKSGNTIGGIYDFSNCSVTSGNIEIIDICGNRSDNTNKSNIIFGGICGGFNGSIGSGGDGGDGDGGNYTFYNCSVISNNNIDISFGGVNNMGGICGGLNCGSIGNIGGSANNSGNGGSGGIVNGGNYSFTLCNVSANNIIMSGYKIFSGCICGGGNGGGSSGGNSDNKSQPLNIGNGGNGGNGYGGNYSFNTCDVSVNNNITITGYISVIISCGGICGGNNGNGGGGGEEMSIGNGGNSGDGDGGTYDFSSCSIKANNIEIRDLSNIQLIAFGGICGGINGTGTNGAGGNADSSGNGGNSGTSDGGTYTFQSCSVILNNSFDITGLFILSGGICGGGNGSLGKGGDSMILGNGGNSGGNYGGIYIFDDCYVIANNNNINGTFIISGGICGGLNGSKSILFGTGGGNGNGIGGNGGDGGDGDGGNYTFNNCSIDAMNGNIQLTGIPFFNAFYCFYGGICGGVNGAGGNGGNAQENGTGGKGGDGFSGIYDFSNCAVIADNNIILPAPSVAVAVNKSGGICSGSNGQAGSGGTGTQSGQNGSNVGGNYTFSVCLVECCEFLYDDVIIEPPGTPMQKVNGLIIGADQSGNTIISNDSYLIKTCIPPPPPPPPFVVPVCCPLKIYGNKPGTIFGGSGSGVQGAYQSAVMNEAQVLKNTAARLAGKTIYVNKQLNVYGSYYGAPAGYGAPPRNSF